MRIQITTAQVEDYQGVNAIVKEGQAEHSEALPYIFMRVEEAIPEPYYHELLAAPNREILIARINEEIVGFAVMEINESPPFETMTPRIYAYMNDFGIKSSYQRDGFGSELFKACKAWSKDKGATSLELNVWEFNQKAISFYEGFGMKSVSRRMEMNL